MKYFFRHEFWLGIGFGLGSLTSLRLIGPIGMSEIILLSTVLTMLFKHPDTLLNFSFSRYGAFKVYLLLTMLIIFPIATLTNIWGGYSENADPIYLISFIFSAILLIVSVEYFIKYRLDPLILTYFYALAFIIPNLILILFGIDPGNHANRYSGFAENPNQITFYSAPLMLLIAMFINKFRTILFLLVLLITLNTASDSFILYILIVSAAYIYMQIFASKRYTFIARFTFFCSFTVLTIFTFIFLFQKELAFYWNLADEAGVRFSLIKNGFAAAIEAPLLGHGSGRFSGISAPFLGWEAHNTPIDLMTNFGILLPFLIYLVMFSASIVLFKNKSYFASALVLGLIESSIFHFSGRHFIFWFGLGITSLIAFNLTSSNKFFDILIKK